ncbi:hypothetical protein QCA50_016109 [Cerrena zonata]|uniref:Uncharacterized protein n=1 Tax=Cerrena zonata TaxID=2478898 RepID=A0AAW0FJ82_9APHY
MYSHPYDPYDPCVPTNPYKATQFGGASSSYNLNTHLHSHSSSPSTSSDNLRHFRSDSSYQLDEFKPLLAQAVHSDIAPERRFPLSSHPPFPPSSTTTNTMSAYDERLLASAPVATRAAKQEGYNVDLLDNSREVPKSGSSSPTPPAHASNIDHAEAQYPKESPSAVLYSSHTQRPWYKTRKWIIIFTLLAIVVVAAVIGGAVGGTLSNKHKNNGDNSAQSNPNGGSTSSGESGADTGASGPQSGQASAATTGTTTTSPTSSATTTASQNPGTEGGNPAVVAFAQPSEPVIAASAIDGVV